jgi:hypothetical protein
VAAVAWRSCAADASVALAPACIDDIGTLVLACVVRGVLWTVSCDLRIIRRVGALLRSGNISAGKSTLCRALADHLKYALYLEPTIENPFLVKYYRRAPLAACRARPGFVPARAFCGAALLGDGRARRAKRLVLYIALLCTARRVVAVAGGVGRVLTRRRVRLWGCAASRGSTHCPCRSGC